MGFVNDARAVAEWLQMHLIRGPFVFFGETFWPLGPGNDDGTEPKPPTNDNDKDAA